MLILKYSAFTSSSTLTFQSYILVPSLVLRSRSSRFRDGWVGRGRWNKRNILYTKNTHGLQGAKLCGSNSSCILPGCVPFATTSQGQSMCAAAINAESRRVDRSIGRILETLQGADPTCTPAIMVCDCVQYFVPSTCENTLWLQHHALYGWYKLTGIRCRRRC